MESLGIIATVIRFLPGARNMIVGPADERAERRSIQLAAEHVAGALLQLAESRPTPERIQHLADVFVETLGRAGVNHLESYEGVSMRRALTERFTVAFKKLDDPDVGLAGLGVDSSARELADRFVAAFVNNLFHWGTSSPLIRSVALQLQLDALFENLDATTRLNRNAPYVRAWVTLETIPPQLEVYNDGELPIYDVVPSPTLIAYDSAGKAGAMIGGGRYDRNAARQISPGYGHCWPLPHAVGWSRDGRITSQVHVDFSDSAGNRWRYAHDNLTRLD